MDTLIPIDQLAPDFTLPDLEGQPHSLADYRGRVVIVNFWSAECHWSERADLELSPWLERWADGVVLLPTASNANEPLDLLRTAAAQRGLPLVLHDPDQRVADLYGARITPHLFVVDPAGILRYQGAFDNRTFRMRQATQSYLRQAVEAVLAGQPPEPSQTEPYGCVLIRHAP